MVAKTVIGEGWMRTVRLKISVCPPSSFVFHFTSSPLLCCCQLVIVVICEAEPKQCSGPVLGESSSGAAAPVTRSLGPPPPPTTSHRQSQQQQHSPQQSSLRTQLSSGDAGPLPGAEDADWRGYTDATVGNSSDTVKCCHSCCSSAAPLHSV